LLHLLLQHCWFRLQRRPLLRQFWTTTARGLLLAMTEDELGGDGGVGVGGLGDGCEFCTKLTDGELGGDGGVGTGGVGVGGVGTGGVGVGGGFGCEFCTTIVERLLLMDDKVSPNLRYLAYCERMTSNCREVNWSMQESSE
jgi:hypothetical protein